MKVISLTFLSLWILGCQGQEAINKWIEDRDPVFVELEPSSLDSLNSKLAPSLENYGEVRGTDFTPIYHYSSIMRDFSEDLAVTVYTDEERIPSGSMYMPLHLRDVFTKLVDGSAKVNSVVVNKNASDKKTAIFTKEQAEQIMQRLPKLAAIPLSISVAK
ncbi:MAG: hypothetical protein K1X79_02655 [Oligoflexia bacterium]|nr:hypothetical protein [Oligoflexia bacterium]